MNAITENTARNHVPGVEDPAAQQAATLGRRTWLSATVATAAGLLAVGTNTARAAPAQSRPFQALVSGSIQPTGPTTFQLSGAGVVTGLGAAQHGGPVTITSVNPDTGVIADTLTETFTAANGSSLTLTCQQIATPVPGSPGVYQSTDQWVVDGGTGRFRGATGAGTGTTLVNLNTLTYIKQCGGSISY